MSCNLGRFQNRKHKWLVCDGDIDGVWIENLNSVMDDNKTLVLATGERIRFSDSMRLLFEVAHVNNASPATVSSL
jgi:dynein heavy chain, axonemal